MKTNTRLLCTAVSLAVLALACGDPDRFKPLSPAVDGGSTDGGGQVVDAGTDAGTDAGVDAGTDAGVDGGTEFANVRIMAANLTSGPDQSYDLGHGIRLMQGVAPDVVLIQEWNYKLNQDTDLREMVDQVGPGFDYFREDRAQIANGIISRWPILESGEWLDAQTSTRDFAWARIDIPGPRDLWAVSVHLLTADSTVRKDQATALVERIKATVPADDYLVVGGDLNTDTRTEPAFGVLSQVVFTSTPYPLDKNRNGNTNASRGKPYDHVFVDEDLRQYQQPTVIGSSTFEGGLVLDSRVYTPLSEIAPVEAGDSGASNMQHMGVVKDFRVPVP